MTDWDGLPVVQLPIDRLRFNCHHIDPGHVHVTDDRPLSAGPIHVEALMDGSFYIHNGRHRVLRAINRGETVIPAQVLRRAA